MTKRQTHPSPSMQDIADTWTDSIHYDVVVMVTGERQSFDTQALARAWAQQVRRTFRDEAMLIRLTTVTERTAFI